MSQTRERLPDQTDLAYVLEPVRIYTYQALQRVLGCSRQKANNLWHGRISIGGKIALDLAEATGLPAEVFLRLGRERRARRKAAPVAAV